MGSNRKHGVERASSIESRDLSRLVQTTHFQDSSVDEEENFNESTGFISVFDSIMNSSDCLNILEQRPGFARLTVNLILCFRNVDNKDDATIVKVIQGGLQDLAISFPWCAGQIVNHGASKSSTGTYKIEPFEATPRLIVKDLRQDSSIPTMEQMEAAKFSHDCLSEEKLAPRSCVLINEPKAVPVLMVQASFIRGGLALCFSAGHSVTDLTGLYTMILSFHGACHKRSFKEDELAIGNMPRCNMIPLLEPGEDFGKEIEQQRPLPQQTRVKSRKRALIFGCMLRSCAVLIPTSFRVKAARWFSQEPSLSTLFGIPSLSPKRSIMSFTFAKKSIDILVADTRATLATEYVSTDDILTAFVWQAVTRARMWRLQTDCITTLARSVNARRYLGIHEFYPGMAINTAFTKLTGQELISMPLAKMASKLREAIEPTTSNFGHYTRAVATALSNTANKREVELLARLDWSTDLILTSGASISEAMPLDFNLGLGSPLAVRVPTPSTLGLQSMAAFMPKSRDGDWTLGLCLSDDDLQRLEADELFTQYASCAEALDFNEKA
ncbi:Trichothecene 3-O-acetyltransferase [Pseudocercospora fuligena]|uniref:Trichothecene 3-O-acetyltransferase n=1 Tax=Pseudocercospora fuligena TaxID=685502 RepID=A0A8H6VP14_9PEZI|nr:Trichothecene 3-O-acetyltransferase [Pseudocercospora fuligena]